LQIYRRLKLPVWLTVIYLLMVVALPGIGRTSGRPGSGRDPNPPPFDFSDNFYEANGINPDRIRERAGNPDRNPTHCVVDNSNTHAACHSHPRHGPKPPQHTGPRDDRWV